MDPHGDLGSRLEREEVEVAGLDRAEEVAARERYAGRVDELEVGRHLLAGGRGVAVDERLQPAALQRAQLVCLGGAGSRRGLRGSERAGDQDEREASRPTLR